MLAKAIRIAAPAALAACVWLAAPPQGSAANYQPGQEHYWNNTAGGSFYTPGNWNTNDVPNLAGNDRANFLQNDVTVTFESGQAQAQVAHVRVDAQNVTFDIRNTNFWATSTSDNGYGRTDQYNGAYPNGLASFVVGQGVGQSGSLTVSNGQFVSNGSVIGADGGTGSLTVTGAGRWRAGQSVGGEVHIGQNLGTTGTATGTLNVTNGGFANLSNTYIGSTSSSNNAIGTVNVSGANARLQSIGRFFNINRGSVSVSNGGSLITNGDTSGNGTGYSRIYQATVTVDGQGSTWNALGGANAHIELNGQSGGGAARLDVTNGGLVTSRYTDVIGNGTIQVDGAGSKMENIGYTMDVGRNAASSASEASRLVVTNGGVFDGRPTIGYLQEAATGIHVGKGAGSIGEIQVDGAGSLLRADSIGLGESATGSGTMTIQNGGVVNTRVLSIGGTTTSAGGAGVVNLESGGQLEVDTLTIWQTGTLNINGGSLVGFYGTNYSVGTLVNNGTINNGTFKIAKKKKIAGSGTFTSKIVVEKEGILAPGNSPGLLTTGSEIWESGGVYEFELNDALGVAGGPAGWDSIAINGTLDIQATSADTFKIDIISLTETNLAGLLKNFDGQSGYQWEILSATGGIIGFDPGKFTLLTNKFQNSLAGQSFRLAQHGNSLFLEFGEINAVPEPSTLVVAGVGLLTLAGNLARKRRANRRQGCVNG